MTPIEARPRPGATRLLSALHGAQADGVWQEPVAVHRLLQGIQSAVVRTVEHNASDPDRSWALASPVYWAHFEMYIKEALLGACTGLPRDLTESVREVLESTLGDLRRRYLAS